jgi:glycosyltransferase involved in cell wall biosynthesis
MNEMIDKFNEGYEIVYGVRNNRDTDTWFKRNTAQLFYKLLNGLGAETVYNHADYRLTSGRVLKELANYGEINLYLRGIFPLIGFKSTTVEYSRHERLAGKSHYPLGKMLGLAINGITNLSIKPIRIITFCGAVVSLISFIVIIWVTIGLIMGTTVQGWASTLGILSFICGIQLISIGVIGEYIGKIYMEVKNRPRYIISDRLNIDKEEE